MIVSSCFFFLFFPNGHSPLVMGFMAESAAWHGFGPATASEVFMGTSDERCSTKYVDIHVYSVPSRPCTTRILAAGPRDEAGRLLLNRT